METKEVILKKKKHLNGRHRRNPTYTSENNYSFIFFTRRRQKKEA